MARRGSVAGDSDRLQAGSVGPRAGIVESVSPDVGARARRRVMWRLMPYLFLQQLDVSVCREIDHAEVIREIRDHFKTVPADRSRRTKDRNVPSLPHLGVPGSIRHCKIHKSPL